MKLARDHSTGERRDQDPGLDPSRGFGASPPAFLATPAWADPQHFPTTETDEGASQRLPAHPYVGTRRHGGVNNISLQERDIPMGKRSARSKKQYREDTTDFQLHALPSRGDENAGAWDPI